MTTFSRIAMTCISALLMTSSAGSMADSAAADSMYQGLGGKEGIRKIVSTFLPIVLEDARIKESFKDADAERLQTMLVDQFCQMSGGPCTYDGENMKNAHADMNLTNAHFNALAEDLQLAMDRQGVPSRVQNRLLAKLAPMQRDVVSK